MDAKKIEKLLEDASSKYILGLMAEITLLFVILILFQLIYTNKNLASMAGKDDALLGPVPAFLGMVGFKCFVFLFLSIQ